MLRSRIAPRFRQKGDDDAGTDRLSAHDDQQGGAADPMGIYGGGDGHPQQPTLRVLREEGSWEA